MKRIRLAALLLLQLIAGLAGCAGFWMASYDFYWDYWGQLAMLGFCYGLAGIVVSFCCRRFVSPDSPKWAGAAAFSLPPFILTLISSAALFDLDPFVWEPVVFWLFISAFVFFTARWGTSLAKGDRAAVQP